MWAIAGSCGTVGCGNGSLTIIGDSDPLSEVFAGNGQAHRGKNIADLPIAAGVSWRSFSGCGMIPPLKH